MFKQHSPDGTRQALVAAIHANPGRHGGKYVGKHTNLEFRKDCFLMLKQRPPDDTWQALVAAMFANPGGHDGEAYRLLLMQPPRNELLIILPYVSTAVAPQRSCPGFAGRPHAGSAVAAKQLKTERMRRVQSCRQTG